MKPYLLPPTERVRHWRELRFSLTKDQTDEEQLLTVAKYWQQFPISNYYIDVDRPKYWPTPWQVLFDSDYCKSTLAYLMEQTLLMSDDRWDTKRLRLILIDDKINSDLFIVLVADNKYVVNYSQDDIIDFDFIAKNCIIQYEYQAITQHKHIIT